MIDMYSTLLEKLLFMLAPQVPLEIGSINNEPQTADCLRGFSGIEECVWYAFPTTIARSRGHLTQERTCSPHLDLFWWYIIGLEDRVYGWVTFVIDIHPVLEEVMGLGFAVSARFREIDCWHQEH